MRDVLMILFGWGVVSNILLWIYIWILRQQMFDMHSDSLGLFKLLFSKELTENPPKDGSEKCSDQTTNKI